MEDLAKAEILASIEAHARELHATASRCAVLGAELHVLRARLENLETRGGAWDLRHTEHDRARSEDRAMLDSILAGVSARHDELATSVDRVASEVSGLKKDVRRSVEAALVEHVERIEAAADTLTKSPRVRTAVAVGGTFAGSAAVAVVFEILKHL